MYRLFPSLPNIGPPHHLDQQNDGSRWGTAGTERESSGTQGKQETGEAVPRDGHANPFGPSHPESSHKSWISRCNSFME